MTKTVLLRVATVNDDFGSRASEISTVATGADILLTQESRDDTVSDLVPPGWTVHQVMHTAGTRGSAVCWRDDGPLRMGSVDQRLAVRGKGINARYLTIVHGRIGEAAVTFIACHRPPGRFKRLWSGFDGRLANYVRALAHNNRLVVVGLDANQRTPQGLARKCGLHWVAPAGSIDGFLISPEISSSNVRRLPKGSSDHHPVLVDLTIKEGTVARSTPPRIEQAYALLWAIINDAREQGKTGYARRVWLIAAMFNRLGVRPRQ